MAVRLAGVISKLLGFVFGDDSKSQLQKRIEWLRVNQEFHGERYQVDGGGRTGQATVTGRNPGYGVGNVVPVVMDKQAPVAIVGHSTLKAQFHPSIPVAVEQVEEIVMTAASNPDGGLDHFLRSWRGIFYLDFRSALAAAGVDPSAYVPFLSNSRFPEETAQWTRFGQKDNTIAVLSYSALVDDEPQEQEFMVVFLFEIQRPEKSDRVPVTEAVKTIGGQDYPVVDLRLIGLYDFAPLSVNTGVSVAASGSTMVRQRLYLATVMAEETWTPAAVTTVEGGANFFSGLRYELSNYEITGFSESTAASGTHSAEITYPIVLDFAHRYFGTHDANRGRGWQLGGTGFTGWNYRYFSHFVPAHPTPYLWRLLDYWVDADGHPIVVMQVENTWQDLAEVFKYQRYVAGVVVDSTVPVNATVGPEDFVERPIFAIRLLGGGIPWGGSAELVSRSCDSTLTVTATRDQWINVPGAPFSVLDATQILVGGTQITMNRIEGPGMDPPGPNPLPPPPPDLGVEVIPTAEDLFVVWSSVPPDNTSTPSPVPPGPSTGVGSLAFEQRNPSSYASSGAKTSLSPLFKNGTAIGTRETILTYISTSSSSRSDQFVSDFRDIHPDPPVFFLWVSGFNSNLLYLASIETIIGFVVGRAPATAVLALLNGRSRRRGDNDCDLYFVNRHALALLVYDPISGNETFQEELILGVWRVQDGEDNAVLLGEFADATVTFSKPNPMLNRDAVLLEHPASEGRRIASLSGDLLAIFPDDLGLGLGPVFSLLAPDRLYDKRDSVGKFRLPSDPTGVLTIPKPLPSLDDLVSSTLFLSTPPLIVHTVGTRADKESI